jgi:hypothetical protein
VSVCSLCGETDGHAGFCPTGEVERERAVMTELTSLRAEVERLRTREAKAVVTLTSIKNQLTKGPVEFAGWSVVAERARREAEAALAEWERP